MIKRTYFYSVKVHKEQGRYDAESGIFHRYSLLPNPAEDLESFRKRFKQGLLVSEQKCVIEIVAFNRV